MKENERSSDTDSAQSSKNRFGLHRRRFIQAAGGAAGAGILGIGMTGTAVADEFTAEFTNWRVQEALKAWNKGFRGRPDRAVGLIGHGLEARHPDLGPWNEVRAVPDGEHGLNLVRQNLERIDVPDEMKSFSGFFGPNVGNKRQEHGPITAPENVDRVEAHLGPAGPAFVSRGLRCILETYPEGEVVEQFQGTSPHSALATWDIEPGEKYQFVAETTFPNNSIAFYSIEANYQIQTEETEHVSDPFEGVDRDNITSDTPKTVGWYNEDWELSEATAKPRTGPRGPASDPRGRSTSIASIMTGSGRASVPDESTVTQEEPDVLVGPGEKRTYEIDAEPGRGVFGCAYGENIALTLEGPNGDQLETSIHTGHESGNYRINVMVDSITVHDRGTKTYKVHIEPARQHTHLGRTTHSPSTAARIKRVSVGAFKPPSTTTGDRTDEDSPSLYAGVAPNSGLIALSGMYKTRDSMQSLAREFATKFNLRSLHIAMGFGVRPGYAGGEFSTPESMKALAEAGILPVSQTDDIAPASQADRAAANADESISVVQAGPHDGVWEGSEPAEPPAKDEDQTDVYRKPDVTANSGNTINLVKCAQKGQGLVAEDEQPPIRDYERYGSVRQAPMVVGQASLVAQALEEEAPAAIAMPPPADAGFEDTMRLKHTILATASETPFTAAPWHKRHPTYNFGGWDPVEGWGRVNIDASVEAASRNLTPPGMEEPAVAGAGADRGDRGRSNAQRHRTANSTTIEETVGLDVPRHSRAVAGYISGKPGVYEVSVSFSDYSGERKAMTTAPPYIDLFVYDAENPGDHGTPNVVEKASGPAGSASLQFSAGAKGDSGSKGGTYYVVAKLVKVPGAFTSLDIRAHIELSVERV